VIVVIGLAVGAGLHFWSEPFGIASAPSAPTRVTTYTGRAEASGPVALRIEPGRVDPAALVLYGVEPPSAGIDCPAGDCATLARAAMEQLLGEAEVHCVTRTQGDGRPAAATCFLPDGTDVAAALVARGWALASGDAPLYRAEEERARAAALGLWARPSETPSEARSEAPSEAQAPAPAAAGDAGPAAQPAPADMPLPTPIGPGGYTPPDE
jgi:endonuclease YncB( thermonuclease family)